MQPLAPIPPNLIDATVFTVARTAWGEARGLGQVGMLHVINTLVNRAEHPRWWGHDLLSVCRQPYQYSCWNADDPNQPKLLAVTEADPQFAVALYLARQAVARMLPDLTYGADSYYAISMRTPPSWASRGIETMRDTGHIFMRLELAAPSGEPEAPNVSIHSLLAAPPAQLPTADELNQAELDRIRNADDD